MSNDEVWDENNANVFDEGEPAPTKSETLKERLQREGKQRLFEIDLALDSNRTTVKQFRHAIAELVSERAELVRILNATTPRTHNRKPTVDVPAPKPARVRKPKPTVDDG